MADFDAGLSRSLRRIDNDTYRMAVDIEDATGVSITATTGIDDDSAFVVGTTDVQPMGGLADETTPDSVDEGDVGALRMTLDRRLLTAGMTTDDAAPETGTRVNMMGGVFDDTTPDSVDEGDAGYVRMSARREQYTQIRDAAGNERGLNVDANGAIAVTGSFVVDSEFPAAAVVTDNFANPTTTSVMGMGMVWDGATWDRSAGNSTDGTLVNLGTNNDVTVTGTVTEANSAAILTSTQLIDDGIATVASAITTKGMAAAGTDGTNARILKTDTDGNLQVDVLTMPSVTVDSEFPAAAGLTDNFATPTTTNVAAMGMVYDGATWDMQRGDATDGTLVNLGTNNDVTVTSGTITTVTTLTGTTTLTPGTGAANLGKAVDSVAGATDTGVVGLSIVDAALSAITPIDGDYAPTRVDANGALWVNVSNSALATAAAAADNFANPTTSNIMGMNMLWDGATWDRAPGTSTTGAQVNIASAGVASGAIASGAVASGAIASGAYASGSIGSGAIASGAIASGAVASGAVASGAYAAGAFAQKVFTEPTAAQSTAYATSLVVKASAGTLYQVFGYNSHTATVFLQVHNTTSLPADTAVPIITLAVPASSNFSLDLNLLGRAFATGITLATSTTGPTLTVSGATTWFNALYV